MKRLLLIAVALLVGGMAMTAQAQVDRMKPIEADKEIRTGVLPNGLTYYVRHNEKPKNMANFYIVHDVGAIQRMIRSRVWLTFWSTWPSTAPRISPTRP